MRKRLSYANVVATLALVLSMTGGALAASHYLINSTKQINPKVLKKLKGNTGRTGPAGQQGSAGSPGPAGSPGVEGKTGPSQAFVSQIANVPFPGSAEAADVVRELTLGAGSYALTATTTVFNESNAQAVAECILMQGVSTLGEGLVTVKEHAFGAMALSGAFAPAAPATVRLACKSSTAQGAYESPTLTAIRVGSLD